MALVPRQRKRERIPRELSITFEKRWDTKWSQVEWTQLVATPYGTLRTPLTAEETQLCRLPHPQLFALYKAATRDDDPTATEEDRRHAAAEAAPIRNAIVAVLSGHVPMIIEWKGWSETGSTQRTKMFR